MNVFIRMLKYKYDHIGDNINHYKNSVIIESHPDYGSHTVFPNEEINCMMHEFCIMTLENWRAMIESYL